MENASKALLIAGAVLIVILIIGVGMGIYSSATENIGSATTQMSSQQIQMQNSQFTPYEGTAVRGTRVKQLLSTIASSNAAGGTSIAFTGVKADGTIDPAAGGDVTSTTSTITSSHTYVVKFGDTNGDGLLDAVYIDDNNN